MNSDVLTTLGLSKAAAQIYLAALSLGSATVQELAEKAGLKRPTAYGHVEELMKEGLLERTPLGKRDYYRPTDPQVLETRAEHALQQIKKAMPELEGIRAATQGRPNISILEGEKGLRQVYEEMEKANSICFWSNLETFEKHFQDVFIKLSEVIGRNQIRTREIITDTPEARRGAKRYAIAAGSAYSARVATVEGIQNDNVVYGGVVALFRLQANNLFVVRIEDPMIAQTMKALFEMAWKTAEEFM